MTNLTLPLQKSNPDFMEHLRSIAAGNTKKVNPPQTYAVASAHCMFSKYYSVTYTTAEKFQKADWTDMKHVNIGIEKLAAFVARYGAKQIISGPGITPHVGQIMPDQIANITKYIFMNASTICEDYINSGEAEL